MAVKTQLMQEDISYVNPLKYGVALNSTTLQAAITNIGSSKKVLILTEGVWNLSANITIPVNIFLLIPAGTTVAVAGGFTLTVNGPYYNYENNWYTGTVVLNYITWNNPEAYSTLYAGYVTSGGFHTVSGNLTTNAFATSVWINGYNITQTALPITYIASANDIVWVIVSNQDTTIAGWVRVGTSRYYYQAQGSTVPVQPTIPSNSVLILQVTITASAIVGVLEVAPRHVVGTEVIATARVAKGVWVVEPGASITLNALLTLNGGIISPVQPIFTGSSTVVFLNTPNIYSEWWGAIANGTTDCTSAINAAITALSAGGTLRLLSGTYLHNDYMTIDGKANLIIQGSNSTLKTANSTATGKGGIEVLNSTNITVQDLIINENRANRTPAETDTHGVVIRHENTDLFFENVHVQNSCTDGWEIYPGADANSVGITIQNCSATNSYRNGMSIIGGDKVQVIGGRYHNSIGTAPQGGIDIETDPGQSVSDIILRGVICDDNVGPGFTIANGGSMDRVTLIDCSGQTNTGGLLIVVGGNSISVYNLRGNSYPSAPTRGIVDFGTNIDQLIVDGIYLDNISLVSTSHHAVYVHNNITGVVSLSNINISNCSCLAFTINVPKARVSDVHLKNCTGTSSQLALNGSLIRLSNVMLDNVAGIPLYIASTFITIDGLTILNWTGTDRVIWADTGCTNLILRDVELFHAGTNPATNCIQVTSGSSLTEISNFNVDINASPWTSATVISSNLAGMANCSISNMRPDPYLSTIIATPGGIAPLTPYAVSGTSQFAKLGDFIDMAVSIDLSDLLSTPRIYSDTNVRVFLYNPSASLTVTLGALTFYLRIRKHP